MSITDMPFAAAKPSDDDAPIKTSIALRETYWGYVITCNTAEARRASLVEAVATIMGLFLIMGAVGHWALPGSDNSPEVLGIKAGASVIFVILGGVLLWYARRGLKTETQIDRVRRSVRRVARNRHGVAHVLTEVPFDEVGSAFVHRTRGPFGGARLFLRFRDTQDLIQIAEGRDAEMEALLGSLSRDLTMPPSDTMRRVAQTGKARASSDQAA